jgi:glutathione S-transferase
VWIALLEKGLPFYLLHIDLSHKPAWYRGVNARGLVPALQHGGQVHLESADIRRWLDSAFPEGPSLVPADAARRADMEALLEGPCSGAVSAGLDLMAGEQETGRGAHDAHPCARLPALVLTNHPPVAGKTGRYWGIGRGQTAAQKAALEAELEQLTAALRRHGGPFLLGPTPTLPDILLYPFIYRFDVGLRGLEGYNACAAGGGAIRGWLDAMGARPSCAAMAADPDLLLAAYQKHQELDFFDYTTYACFALHPQNAARLIQ